MTRAELSRCGLNGISLNQSCNRLQCFQNPNHGFGLPSLPATSTGQRSDSLPINIAHILIDQLESIGIYIYISTYTQNQGVFCFEMTGDEMAKLPLSDI